MFLIKNTKLLIKAAPVITNALTEVPYFISNVLYGTKTYPLLKRIQDRFSLLECLYNYGTKMVEGRS